MSKQEALKEKMGISINEKATTALSKARTAGTLAGLSRKQVQDALMPLLPSLASSLPKHLTGERMFQMMVTVIDQNPAIKDCELSSIVGCVMQASILGFKPVSNLGQVYFIPYNDRQSGKKFLQMQIGYRGYIDLARRSGQIKMLYAEVVREGDKFEYELGLEPKLIHVPQGDDTKLMTHVYAVAHYTDGGYNFIVLSKREVEKLRTRNPMQRNSINGAWVTDYEAMAKAKAIKQLSKYMPLSDDMFTAVTSDESIVKVDDAGETEQFYPDATEYAYEMVDEKLEVNTETGEVSPAAVTVDDKFIFELTSEKPKGNGKK